MNINNDVTNATIFNNTDNNSVETQNFISSDTTTFNTVKNEIDSREIVTLNTIRTSIKFTPIEFIEKVKQNTLPDCAITVKGDARITDCDIFRLPKKLVVTGRLIITRCHNITSILEDITAKSISVSDCNNFTGLSNNTKINKKLNISNCNNFVKLPENLRISHLYINNCSQISKLPEDVTVSTVFSIYNCPKITSLPQQFQKPKKLPIVYTMSITSCDNIIIPEGLRVLDELTLKNCNNIISLPEMDVWNLTIDSCINFQHMPNEFIFCMGNITVKNCKKLISFPESWFHYKKMPYTTASYHIIKFINTGINEEYINSFMKNCPLENIMFTTESNGIITSLAELINFWQSKAENKDNINLDKLTTTETRDLLKFFNILTKTNSYCSEDTRKDLANRVLTILKRISINNWFRIETLKVIQNTITYSYDNNTYTDRVLISLGKLEFLPRLYNLIEDASLFADELINSEKSCLL